MTVLDSATKTGQAPAASPAAASGRPSHPAAISRDPEARLAALFDPGTLRLLTPHDDSGALAAAGKIDGVLAMAYASDPRVQGGAMGSAGCAAILAAYDEAIAHGVPVIGLLHSGGARLREGAESLHAVGTVFAAMTRASGALVHAHAQPSRSRTGRTAHRQCAGGYLVPDVQSWPTWYAIE